MRRGVGGRAAESILVLALVVLLVLATNNASGESTTVFEWVRGGEVVASISSRPYMALWVDDANNVLCSAIIVSPRALLVTAHCIQSTVELRGAKEATYVVAGIASLSDIASAPQRRRVVNVASFPRYGESSGGKDVGLIFLNSGLDFTDPNVKSVNLPTDFDAEPTVSGTVIGWAEGNGELRSGRVTVISAATASERLGNRRVFPDETFVVNDPLSAETPILCGGLQSGSPFVAGNFVFGLMSNVGFDCEDALAPAVLTKIYEVIPWLLRALQTEAQPNNGLMSYVLGQNISSEVYRAPTKAPTKKRKGKKKKKKSKKQPTKSPTVETYVNSYSYRTLVPHELKLIRFVMEGGTASNVGLRVRYDQPTFPTNYACINSVPGLGTKMCTILAPLSGIWVAEVFPLEENDYTGQLEDINVRVDYEMFHGLRRVRSTHNNGTIPKAATVSYLAIPVIPNNLFSAVIRSHTPKISKQRLIVTSGTETVSKWPAPAAQASTVLCTQTYNVAHQGECSFMVPETVNTISLSVLGIPKKAAKFSLEFEYGRIIGENGLPGRTTYSVAGVPKNSVRRFEKRFLVPGEEFSLQFEPKKGVNEVAVFLGGDENSDAPDCLLTNMIPGNTYFCAIVVRKTAVDGRVFVTTTTGPGSYEMTLFF